MREVAVRNDVNDGSLMDATKQFTSLLDNSTLARVERMRLLPMRRMTNRSRGEHLAGKGGTSTEFNDYRDYSAGDIPHVFVSSANTRIAYPKCATSLQAAARNCMWEDIRAVLTLRVSIAGFEHN